MTSVQRVTPLRSMARLCDEWVSVIVGVAGLAYIARCLPALLAPSTLPGFLVTFLAGALATVLLLVALVVCVFLLLTKQQRVDAAPLAHTPPADPMLPFRDPNPDAAPGVEADDLAPLPELPPPSTSPPKSVGWGGEYSGYVWTVPASKYDRTDIVPAWPPTKSPNLGARRWFATLARGQLLLQLATEQEPPPGAKPRPPPLRRHIVVPLRGCGVRVVTEGLQGRTLWVRKGPMEITSAEGQPLLYNEPSFMLFSVDGASKEQWFVALLRASGATPEAARAQELYAQFYSHLRRKHPGVFPQVGEQLYAPGQGAAGPDEPRDGPGQGAGGLRWALRTRSMFRRSRGGGAGRAAGDNVRGRQLPEGMLPPTVNPDELDRLWYHSAVGSKFAPAASAEEAAERPVPGAPPPLPPPPRSLSPSPPQGASPRRSGEGAPGYRDDEPGGPSANQAPASVSTEAAAPGTAGNALVGESGDEARVSESWEGDTGDAADAGVPAQAAPPTPQASGSPRSTATPGPPPLPSLSPPSALPGASLPVEYAVNQLLARGAFDFLRNPAFKAFVKAKLQRKLALEKVPDFISTLTVVDVNLGTAVPVVANIRAAPCSGTVLWPQAYYDLQYEGDMEFVIETKVDLREGSAWSQFDRAMSQLAGGAAGVAVGVAAAAGAGADGEEAKPAGDGALPRDGDVLAATKGELALTSDEQLALANDVDSDEEAAAAEEEEEAEEAVPGAEGGDGGAEGAAAGPGSRGWGTARQRLMGLMNVRKAAAQTIRQIADRTADQLSRIPLRLKVSVRRLQGPMYVWLPPPPSNRLWFCFVEPPELDVRAVPELGSRILRHTASAARVSGLIERKLRHSVMKNLVYPCCSEVAIPLLLPLGHASVDAPLDRPVPTAAEYEAAAAAAAAAAAGPLATPVAAPPSPPKATVGAPAARDAEHLPMSQSAPASLAPGAAPTSAAKSAAQPPPAALAPAPAPPPGADVCEAGADAPQLPGSEPQSPVLETRGAEEGGELPAASLDDAAAAGPTRQRRSSELGAAAMTAVSLRGGAEVLMLDGGGSSAHGPAVAVAAAAASGGGGGLGPSPHRPSGMGGADATAFEGPHDAGSGIGGDEGREVSDAAPAAGLLQRTSSADSMHGAAAQRWYSDVATGRPGSADSMRRRSSSAGAGLQHALSLPALRPGSDGAARPGDPNASAASPANADAGAATAVCGSLPLPSRLLQPSRRGAHDRSASVDSIGRMDSMGRPPSAGAGAGYSQHGQRGGGEGDDDPLAPRSFSGFGSGGSGSGNARRLWLKQGVAATQAGSQKFAANVSNLVKSNAHLSNMNDRAKWLSDAVRKHAATAEARVRKVIQPQAGGFGDPVASEAASGGGATRTSGGGATRTSGGGGGYSGKDKRS